MDRCPVFRPLAQAEPQSSELKPTSQTTAALSKRRLSEIASLFYNRLSCPENRRKGTASYFTLACGVLAENVENSYLSLLAHDLEQSGCATRFKNARTLEVYGINLGEHYLLTLRKPTEARCDLLFVPPPPSDQAITKPLRCRPNINSVTEREDVLDRKITTDEF